MNERNQFHARKSILNTISDDVPNRDLAVHFTHRLLNCITYLKDKNINATLATAIKVAVSFEKRNDLK